MSDRDGGGAPLDGAFLLQLLRRPPQSQPAATVAPPLPHEVLPPPHRDPAVAAVGPGFPFLPHSFLPPPRPTPPPSEHYPEPHHFIPPPIFARDPWRPPGFLLPGTDYITRPSASEHRTNPGHPQRNGGTGDNSPHNFSSNRASGSRGPGERGMPNTGAGFRKATVGGAAGVGDGMGNWMEKGRNSNPGQRRLESFPRSGTTEERRTHLGSFRKGQGEWVASKGRQDGMHIAEKVEDYRRKENSRPSPSCSEADRLQGEWSGSRGRDGEVQLNLQLDQYRNTLNGNQNSVEGLDGEDYLSHPQNEDAEGNVSEVRRLMKHSVVDSITTIEDDCEDQYVSADQLMDSQMLNGDPVDGKGKRHPNGWRGKMREEAFDASKEIVKMTKKAKDLVMIVWQHCDLRSDSFRGHHVSSQRMRIWRRGIECRQDIETLSSCFISIYESLIPAEVEIDRQKQLLLSLENLVTKEWPNARLHLYGSCANSFGVSKSDIDICLAIEDLNMSKSDILLKLADILQADKLENVQALTHARVPIVKMMDPVTGISCDICINNLLAVVNTKLLRDYAQIDERLRQLAFIVKHWAKSRGVNETYRGTLSSYAYVLMCIHFLQLRKPAILPCLQEMESTYVVTVDDTRCAYYDQVENLRGFGVQNKENIARLLWAFFHYWAYCHDYTNDVISIRTGRMISKRVKDWTRRIGNDRHLICIEDPFETSHDLGRVVDKFSIKILREEFERAAEILQNDPDPSRTLFEPYVPGPTQN